MRPAPDQSRAVAAARLWAATQMPYLAAALFASGVQLEAESGTISVDRGWQIHADPELLDRLPPDQLGRLLLHLAGHLIRDHAARAERLQVSDQQLRGRWNRCADAEINDDLMTVGCLPEMAPDLPADLGCSGSGLAEAYFRAAREGDRRWDCGSGADGSSDPLNRTAPQIQPGQAELLRLTVAAEIQRQGQELGTVPGGWLRWADTVLPSRIDWRRVLAAEVRSALAAVAGSADYSYRRPSRRSRVSAGVVLPTLHRPVPEIAIVCDTSGSMHERLLARALTEVDGVLAKSGARQRQVRVLAVDTAVQAVRRVSRAAQVELAGGGGTNMGTGIEAAARLRPRPRIIIVLTDGYTPWPEAAPAGARVVVGLLTEGHRAGRWPAPAWARLVEIDDAIVGDPR